MAKVNKWIIVKFASKDYSKFHFEKDPTKGVDVGYSAHGSFSGGEVKILPLYTDENAAIQHCAAINEYNPSGGYAVCPVDYKKTAVKH